MSVARSTEVRTRSAEDVLRRHGRTFSFARTFLTAEQGHKAARLYAFCRYIDDLADEAEDMAEAGHQLAHVQAQLRGEAPAGPDVADFLALAAETGMDLSIAGFLIEGVRSDLGPVAFETEADLLRYAYKVAGTVGLMMCRVLNVSDRAAYPFAIDLGVAMQLTNIARDIREDALNGRRYVPGGWVRGASADDIVRADGALRPLLAEAAHSLLDMAEHYYDSAYDGLAYLPARSRFAILIAARVYRQIGVKIKRQSYAVWQGRAMIGLPEKLSVAASAGVSYLRDRRFHQTCHQHNAGLHRALQGLTGAHRLA